MSLETGAKKLGARIREKRLKQELMLKALAKKTDLSIQYLSEIERGRKLPTLDKLVKIAGALRTTTVELLSGISPFGRG